MRNTPWKMPPDGRSGPWFRPEPAPAPAPASDEATAGTDPDDALRRSVADYWSALARSEQERRDRRGNAAPVPSIRPVWRA